MTRACLAVLFSAALLTPPPAFASAPDDAQPPQNQAADAVYYGRRLEPRGRAVLHGVGQDHPAFLEYTNQMKDMKPSVYMAYVGMGKDAPRRLERLARTLADMDGHYVAVQVGMGLRSDRLPPDEKEEILKEICKALEAFPHPIFLRLGFEFNGNWNNYDPEQFRKGWVEFSTILRKYDTDHVALMWCYAPDEKADFMNWYPGDEHVDWWSIDPFSERHFSSSVTMEFMDEAVKRGFPVMYGESSPRFISATRGELSWRVWFQRFFDLMEKYPNIKGFCYIAWNWEDHHPYSTSSYSLHWWGDARVWRDAYVFNKWREELAKPHYIHAGAREYLHKRLGLGP